MKLLLVITLLICFTVNDCRVVKNGVFDNVSVLIESGNTAEIILIDFDDNLGPHLKNKPAEIVTIRNQFIPKLEADSVSNLALVKNLTIVQNGLRDIRRGAFKNLPHLKALNLSHNEIEEVHQFIFNDLPMEDLYLDHNKISRIGYKAFSDLHLKNLFLQNNKISRWSKDWFTRSSVLFLDMSFNQIEDLPSYSLQSMSPVDGSTLIFSSNQLKKIHKNVFKGFENFKSIYLDSNSIDRLDTGAFNGVKYINTVNLNNNSLTEISADVFKNTRVEVLMVEDNKLKCLSTELFHMEELDVDGNPISCFCVKTWLDWRDRHSNPSIYHITDLEGRCI